MSKTAFLTKSKLYNSVVGYKSFPYCEIGYENVLIFVNGVRKVSYLSKNSSTPVPSIKNDTSLARVKQKGDPVLSDKMGVSWVRLTYGSLLILLINLLKILKAAGFRYPFDCVFPAFGYILAELALVSREN